VRSPRPIALRRAKGLQGATPGDDPIEHAGDRRLQMGTRLEVREILEIGEEGEADLRPHVGELDVALSLLLRRECEIFFSLAGRGLFAVPAQSAFIA
jgi:hypothetical protein